MIKGAAHLWFGDGATKLPDGGNPDCQFFARAAPDRQPTACRIKTPLIEPEREKLITRTAVADFFDAYLKKDTTALARLRAIGKAFPEASLLRED
jgi:hypothetical protein